MPRRLCYWPCIALIFLLWGLPARADQLSVDRGGLYANYAGKLAAFAAQCDQQQQGALASEIRAWLPRRQADELTLFVLPSTVIEPHAAAAEEPTWRNRFQDLRNAQAEAIFALAARAAANKQGSLAYELAVETVHENPQHEAARKLLGYVLYQGAWRTPFERRQLEAGRVWHPQFGWLVKDHVQRYEQGERFYRARWMTAAQETALRSDIRNGWKVESDHYVVTTNHSLEEGVRLTRQLEAFYSVWLQAFNSYQTGEAELARRFEKGSPRPVGRQHNVTYFRTRQEYNDALKDLQPQIGITLGIYFGKAKMAYFFAGNDQHAGTIYHEATHQLFQESRADIAAELGKSNNFWILEGIACYLETLEPHGRYMTLGGASAGRMPAARERLLEDRFYVPLAELVRMGMETLQNDPRIRPLYSQSAGLAQFLMHADNGRYREPLIRYLQTVYNGKATAKTLADVTGTDYATLDGEYRSFVK